MEREDESSTGRYTREQPPGDAPDRPAGPSQPTTRPSVRPVSSGPATVSFEVQTPGFYHICTTSLVIRERQGVVP